MKNIISGYNLRFAVKLQHASHPLPNLRPAGSHEGQSRARGRDGPQNAGLSAKKF